MNIERKFQQNIEKSPEKEEEMLKTELVSYPEKEILDELTAIEQKSFPNFQEEALLNQNDFEEYISNKENVVLIARIDNKIIGYDIAIPLKDAILELEEFDPEIKKGLFSEDLEKTYYGESIAVLRDFRSQGCSVKIAEKMTEELKNRGAKKFVVHIRSQRSTHDKSTESFLKNAKVIRTIKNWLDSGEDFDYIEYEI